MVAVSSESVRWWLYFSYAYDACINLSSLHRVTKVPIETNNILFLQGSDILTSENLE